MFPSRAWKCFLYYWQVITIPTFQRETYQLSTGPCYPTLLYFPFLFENISNMHWATFPILGKVSRPTGKCFPSLLGKISHSHWETFSHPLGYFYYFYSHCEMDPTLILKISHSYWETFSMPTEDFHF